jgi:hypothetical protein
MSSAALWAETLNFSGDIEQLRNIVLRHIRDAVREGGYVSRGRITSGIKEAYRPLGIDDDALRTTIDEAIGLLMLSGDIDELTTGAGRGYAATPPRRIVWGGADDAILGGAAVSSDETVRKLGDAAALSDLITIALVRELGRPAWRNVLVELGGSDEPAGDARALSDYARALTSSGERFGLDEPHKVAVLSGIGSYYGFPHDLSGRWARATDEGFYPAVVETGYTRRRVLLAVQDDAATLWEPPNRDAWHWIIVGFTLGRGSPVWKYDLVTETLEFLTPPPRQAERAAMLTGKQLTSWSWRIDAQAQGVIADLLGAP